MSNTKLSVLELTYIAMFTVLIAVCSWISIPTAVPFTLQTFAIFLTIRLLGARRALFSILTYLLLGAVGVPVFAGFHSGIGVLLGSTGGYLVGFLLMPLVALYVLGKDNGRIRTALAMVGGLIVCYAFGTAWFLFVYTRTTGALSLSAALAWCVFPFVIPDLGKMLLALWLGNRLAPHVKL